MFGSCAAVFVASAELTEPGGGSSVFVAAPASDGAISARTRRSGSAKVATRRFIRLRSRSSAAGFHSRRRARRAASLAAQPEVVENGRRDVAQGPLLALVGRLRAAADEEQRPEAVVGVERPVAAAARVARAAPVDR